MDKHEDYCTIYEDGEYLLSKYRTDGVVGLICEAMEDNIITNKEYNRISDFIEQQEIEVCKSLLNQGCKEAR